MGGWWHQSRGRKLCSNWGVQGKKVINQKPEKEKRGGEQFVGEDWGKSKKAGVRSLPAG